MKPSRKVLAVLCAAALLLTACAGSANSATSGTGSQPVSAAETAELYLSDWLSEDDFVFEEDAATASTDYPELVGTVRLQCKSRTVSVSWHRPADDPYSRNYLAADGIRLDLGQLSGTASVAALEDMLLVWTRGPDIACDTLYAFNAAGRQVLKVSQLDDNGMYLTNFDEPGLPILKPEGSTLRFQGSRRYHGMTIFQNTGSGMRELELRDAEGKRFIDPVPEDETIEATYTIQYLGNNCSFGPLVKEKTTQTYAELKVWYEQEFGSRPS